MTTRDRDLRETPPRDKKLNEMNRLGDMLHFPAPVNAGATVNVLITVAVTWWVVPHFMHLPVENWRGIPAGAAPVLWVVLVLVLNLLPVVLLRLRGDGGRPYPALARMDFVRDQHRFSDWVYVAASADMAFWVLGAWAVFSTWHTGKELAAAELLAFACTFSPVLLRPLLERRRQRRA